MINQKAPEIHIIVGLDGSVNIEVFNAQGPTCTALSKPYTDLFDAKITVKKPEYNDVARQQQQQSQKL